MVQTLFSPKSIAVVGASAARPTAGTAVIVNLRRLGYQGQIFPVNPKYPEVEGLRCYPSLEAIPEAVEAAFLGVPAPAVPALVEEAGRRGISTVAVTASGFADAGPDGVALQAGLVEVATAHGVALCGPNNMGVVNWLDGVAIWTGTLTPPLSTGPVGVISQSGSVAMLCAADDRNVGFGIIINSGNEAILTSAEYLDALVRDDRIRIILHFLEEVKRPAAYAAAAEEAKRRGKPVVVLKVGRTKRGRQATVAHTGSLAGADEEFDAFCRGYGILRVATLDEMFETAELFTKARRVPRRPGACLLAMSGGEIALLSDLATEAALPLPDLAPETREGLGKIFPSYSTIANPLDAWGAGWNPDAYRAAVEVLLNDPGIGVIGCAIDPDARNARANTPVSREMAEIYRAVLRDAPPEAPGVVFFNNVSAGLSPIISAELEGSGIAYLQGTSEALCALALWIQFHVSAPHSGATVPSVVVGDRPPAALERLLAEGSGPVLSERASASLLAAYGIPVARAMLATSSAEAARHAAAIGYPVVMKAASAALPHKTDVGGVILGVRSASAARSAYNTIVDRVRQARPDVTLDGVLVAEMVPPGLDLMMGVSVGPYGPVVVVGQGGIDVEVHRDVANALAPLDADEADAMLGRLRLASLLGASRGRPARDRAVVVDILVALSRLAAECGPWIAAVDLNPVIVHEAGCGACAVDALVVARAETTNGRMPNR